jgi:hypothetical protein
MDILASPLSLFVIIVLSIISTFFCWRGFREKDIPSLLIGTGLSVPTFDIADYRFWLAGAALFILGVWLAKKLSSI